MDDFDRRLADIKAQLEILKQELIDKGQWRSEPTLSEIDKLRLMPKDDFLRRIKND